MKTIGEKLRTWRWLKQNLLRKVPRLRQNYNRCALLPTICSVLETVCGQADYSCPCLGGGVADEVYGFCKVWLPKCGTNAARLGHLGAAQFECGDEAQPADRAALRLEAETVSIWKVSRGCSYDEYYTKQDSKAERCL